MPPGTTTVGWGGREKADEVPSPYRDRIAAVDVACCSAAAADANDVVGIR